MYVCAYAGFCLRRVCGKCLGVGLAKAIDSLLLVLLGFLESVYKNGLDICIALNCCLE